MINAVVVGNLGADATTRDAGGTPVVSFRVASSEKRGKDREEQTTWVACSFFGARAVAVSQFLVKGKTVAVSGSLSTREYEKDGEKRTSVDLNVDNLQLLGGGADKGGEARSGAAPGRPGGMGHDGKPLPF